MRVDHENLKGLLNVFLDSEKHFTNMSNFMNSKIEIDDKFLFHMQILEDKNFVATYTDDKFLGYSVALSGNTVWVDQPLRLTAESHEFADSLNKVEIFEVLKNEFKDASISTLASVSKELMIAFAKKQAKKYFDEDI